MILSSFRFYTRKWNEDNVKVIFYLNAFICADTLTDMAEEDRLN